MRALGPGSVSSFLKIILDVVFVALWIGLGAVALMMLAAVLDLTWGQASLTGVVTGLTASGAYSGIKAARTS